MAYHYDPTLANCQKRCASSAFAYIHPDEIQATMRAVPVFQSAALSRKFDYANRNGISICLNTEELAAYLNELKISGKT